MSVSCVRTQAITIADPSSEALGSDPKKSIR